MLVLENQLYRVKAGGGDYVYQPTRHYVPDMIAYCPHCWNGNGAMVDLPPVGDNGMAFCHTCRSFTQVHTPIDFDIFYALED